MQQFYKNYEELLRDIVCVNGEVNIADRLVYLNYVIKFNLIFSNIRCIKKRQSSVLMIVVGLFIININLLKYLYVTLL